MRENERDTATLPSDNEYADGRALPAMRIRQRADFLRTYPKMRPDAVEAEAITLGMTWRLKTETFSASAGVAPSPSPALVLADEGPGARPAAGTEKFLRQLRGLARHRIEAVHTPTRSL
jgi:hypothetical protein